MTGFIILCKATEKISGVNHGYKIARFAVLILIKGLSIIFCLKRKIVTKSEF